MFSIVIANWNGEKFLEILLNSLKRQTYSAFKVYLVDNNSIDGSIKKVQDSGGAIDTTIIRLDKNYGFASATNVGIEAAMRDKCSHVVTLNNDIELEPRCLQSLRSAIQKNKGYDIFQILMLNYFERNTIDAAGIAVKEGFDISQLGYKENISKLEEINPEIQGACAGAAAYSKKALERVHDRNGYFDAEFFAYYEDVDLALRLLSKGLKTYLVKNAIAYHIHSGTGIEGSEFKTYYLTRNPLLCSRKNLDKASFNRFKSKYYRGIIKRFLTCFMKLDIKNLRAIARGLWDYHKLTRRVT